MSKRVLTGVRITVKTSVDGKSTYEEIEPLVPLAAKVSLGKGIDAAMLRNAEAAMAVMAVDFPTWAAKDLQRLRLAAAELRQGAGASALETVQAIAHDMKGQGGSFGYALVTLIANSLCQLLADRANFDARTHAAIGTHLDAFGVVLTQRLSGPQADMAQRLGNQLDGLVAHLNA